MLLGILLLGGFSFVLALLATALMIRIAPRLGLVDKPGGRKVHDNPRPLGGGVAIFIAFALPMLIGLAVINFADVSLITRFISHPDAVAFITGAQYQTKLSFGLLAVMLIMHAMGLRDDRKALGPYVKLVIQLAATAALVIAFDLRALTALGYWPSLVLTVLWIVGITNAFNFLDNMDGLSAGVAAVCATAFLITAISIEQWFVAATLALLLGALLGFLLFNFPPAKIFMGDSGSLVIGFVLGVLTVRTTYLAPGEDFGRGWYAVFAPVIVLALPLYDLIVVSIIRISRGKSPFVGDTNHFSHRLVARGMSRRTAVLCLYLVTAATSVAAIILPHVRSTFAAMLIFVQTILVLG
ncbi:MAG: undecaprenyl/decaprenyl-phosphate alpha-N-acetylglucosaminyl 1-phosphate transferase, partial [Anaerolineae bacterium]|nr:undecaprenyl/decaprenyl-phosphate alpha-N-acetylglucosaminyl 1-phosphate transferase [Phycisphaerae bacterium]